MPPYCIHTDCDPYSTQHRVQSSEVPIHHLAKLTNFANFQNGGSRPGALERSLHRTIVTPFHFNLDVPLSRRDMSEEKLVWPQGRVTSATQGILLKLAERILFGKRNWNNNIDKVENNENQIETKQMAKQKWDKKFLSLIRNLGNIQTRN